MRLRSVLLLAVCVAVLLWALPLDSWFEGRFDFVAHLGNGLADALLIAAFLAATVDVFVKRRLAEEIVRDVSPHIAAASLPRELREELHVVSNINCYRSNMDLLYQISSLPEDDNFVSVDAECRYQLVNLSNEPCEHRHFVSVQKPFATDGNLKQILFVKAAHVMPGDEYELTCEDGQEDIGKDDNERSHKVWERTVRIPAGGTGEFTSKTYQILHREHEETFVSVHATVNFTIRVIYEPGVHVTVTLGHRNRSEVRKSPKGRPTTWEFKGGLLPYQPIILEWLRTPIPSVPPAKQAAEKTRRTDGGQPMVQAALPNIGSGKPA